MEIEIIIDGETHVFRNETVTGYMFRRALMLKEKQEEEKLTGTLLTELAQFVVETFDKQFTLTQLLNGISAHELVNVCNTTLRLVLNATLKYQNK